MNPQTFDFTSFLTLIGGLGVFLYGMFSASDSLRRVAGDRMRMFLGRMTRNPLTGVGTGVGATVLLQSSSAVTVMLVTFAGAGLMTLTQAAGVILGSDIGTTVTVQVLAFRVAEYSLLAVFGGVVVMLASKSRRGKDIGSAIVSVGLLFFGMELMGRAMAPLKGSESVITLFAAMAEKPVLGVLVSAVFAAIVQSSAATIGIALVLASSGLISLEAALPIILGANVGTAATALIASVGGRVEAKRVAWAHVIFKVAGTLVALPLLGPFASLVKSIGGDLPRQIAVAHSAFNVVVTMIVLPVVRPWTHLVSRMIRPTERDEVVFAPKHLDGAALSDPADAIGRSVRETMRMADEVIRIVRRSFEVFSRNDRVLLEQLRATDDRVDCLDEAISDYLASLPNDLDESLSKRRYQVLVTVKELEQIADEVVKQLLGFAERKIKVGYYFSDEGFSELQRLHGEVADATEAAINAFAGGEPEQGRAVVDRIKDLIGYGRQLRRAHLARLSHAVPETRATSTIHIDILSTLNHIAIHVGNIGYAIIGKL
jgi:phosphate:Na+ symporter